MKKFSKMKFDKINRFFILKYKSSRRNGIISRFDLSHHRAYRSVHGGSVL